MKKHPLVLTAILILVIMLAGVVWRILEVKHTENLRFSNTQTWDETLLPLRSRETKLVTHAYSKIHLKEAPQNTSTTTIHELKRMHEMSTLRTDETLRRIEVEKNLIHADIGEYTFAEIVSTSTHPATTFFVQASLSDLSGLIMQFKDTFDRVRPSHLDPSLSTTIDVPNHPSYPSGHAAQSYFIALLMGELDPSHKDAYIESALRIANGREIAGVHYPTDSEAGRSLATQYFNLLKETTWYAIYFELAKKEWEVEKN